MTHFFLLVRVCLLIHVAGQFEAVAQELWQCNCEVRARELLSRVAVLDGFLQYLMFRDIQVCLGVGVPSGHSAPELVFMVKGFEWNSRAMVTIARCI